MLEPGTEAPVPAWCWQPKHRRYRGCVIVLGRIYFARQASTLLKFAKSTSNPELAASLIERAADLKAQIDAVEKPIPSPHAPDVESDH
jgi:hypothetical protein